MRKIYRQVDVWVRLEDQRIAVYRCFEVLPDRKYCVQSKDFFSVPVDLGAVRESEKRFFELLAEEAPEVRTGAFNALEEAIQNHDQEFS
jgi:hypothetical protein